MHSNASEKGPCKVASDCALQRLRASFPMKPMIFHLRHTHTHWFCPRSWSFWTKGVEKLRPPAPSLPGPAGRRFPCGPHKTWPLASLPLVRLLTKCLGFLVVLAKGAVWMARSFVSIPALGHLQWSQCWNGWSKKQNPRSPHSRTHLESRCPTASGGTMMTTSPRFFSTCRWWQWGLGVCWGGSPGVFAPWATKFLPTAGQCVLPETSASQHGLCWRCPQWHPGLPIATTAELLTSWLALTKQPARSSRRGLGQCQSCSPRCRQRPGEETLWRFYAGHLGVVHFQVFFLANNSFFRVRKIICAWSGKNFFEIQNNALQDQSKLCAGSETCLLNTSNMNLWQTQEVDTCLYKIARSPPRKVCPEHRLCNSQDPTSLSTSVHFCRSSVTESWRCWKHQKFRSHPLPMLLEFPRINMNKHLKARTIQDHIHVNFHLTWAIARAPSSPARPSSLRRKGLLKRNHESCNHVWLILFFHVFSRFWAIGGPEPGLSKSKGDAFSPGKAES